MNKDSDLSQNCIDISFKNIESPEWIGKIKFFCEKLLKHLGKENWEVSLLFCDDSFISELNEKYRAKSGPTDVLAFPQTSDNIEFFRNTQSEKIYAGDIVISLPTLLKNAYNLNVHKEEELKRLIIHGILHLAGMDHKKDGCELLILQEKLLKGLTGG